jgi:acyl-CoA reductase-like NAD-dependent aldehyde dehydrogenase
MQKELADCFDRMRVAATRDPNPPYERREQWLQNLQHMLHERAEEFCSAIASDFGSRSGHETRLLEVLPSLEVIAFARRHLRTWISPEVRKTSVWFLPGRASVRYEPLGVVGIIVPWNYPVYLTMAPLVGALAAGNRVLLKLSELAPATGRLMQNVVADAFADGTVSAFVGDAGLGRSFASLPFDHILFTGSTAVGLEVMKLAAQNLTPVTLELGGKSPAIVADGYPLAHAAERIVLGKCLNAGQTCIAPDYALVPEAALDGFLQEASRAAMQFYPDLLTSDDYTAIINKRHYERLMGWLAEARHAGAKVLPLVPGAEPNPQTRRIPPLVVIGAPEHCSIMREEIFGPILPVKPYASLDEAIRYVMDRPRPLALYYFDDDAAGVDVVLQRTKAGGVTINDVLFHIAQEDLPFGGLGTSGMGRYHGREGFKTFSNAKAIFHQSRLAPATWLSPPYTRRIDRMIRYLTAMRK